MEATVILSEMGLAPFVNCNVNELPYVAEEHAITQEILLRRCFPRCVGLRLGL